MLVVPMLTRILVPPTAASDKRSNQSPAPSVSSDAASSSSVPVPASLETEKLNLQKKEYLNN